MAVIYRSGLKKLANLFLPIKMHPQQRAVHQQMTQNRRKTGKIGA
jgi:hypothetical protein